MIEWVKIFFNPYSTECKDCLHLDVSECQIGNGQEQPAYCPALRDHVRYESVTLYGEAKRLFEKVKR